MAVRHYDEAWSRLSRLVRLEEPVCYSPGCGRPSTSADHIVPVSEAPWLRLVRSNVRGSCALHNMGRVRARIQLRDQVVRSTARRREW